MVLISFSWNITVFSPEGLKLLTLNVCTSGFLRTGPWFNIKMSSCQYKNSHCGDKMILRPSCLHNGISYTGKMTSFYWISPQAPVPLTVFRSNPKFDQNLECSSLKYALPITMEFCTHHDSVTVWKISLWSVELISNQNITNFGRISNSIERSLVGRAPGPSS